MNKIYKVVWSRARQCYVVVSEYAKRQTKSASTKKLLAAFFAAGIVLGAGGLAQANHMMDGSIVAGSDNSSKGIDTFVSGTGNTVIGTDNLVSGYKNTLKEYKSAANGYVSGATKKETSYSLVAGSENSLAGHYGAVHGSQNTVTGTYSTAWGASNTINNMMQIKHITVSGQEVFDEGKDDGLMATVWGNDNVIKADGKSSTLVVSDGGTGTGDWGGKLATVWGDHNTVQGLASTVWGSGNTVGALARYSTVWGSGNEVGEGVFHATVWGAENVVSGKIMYATVFGTKNKADTQANAALVSGKANTVSGDSSSVLGGVYNTVSGENSLAGGSGSVADGDSAFALGTSEAALAAKEEAKSGKGAMAKGDGAIALDGSATGKGAIAIGMGAASNMDHGIALGKGSLTTRNAGDHNAYGKGTSDTGAAWIATDAALAIGNDTAGSLVTRQITGAAAGSADTDAVNVAQLENIADKVKTITVNSDGVKNLTLTPTENNYNIDLAKNIDLGEKGSLSIGRDNKISSNGYLAVGLNNEASGAYSSITGGLNNEASGQYSTVTGGEGGQATSLLASVIGGKGSIASGEGSVAWGDHTEANGKYSTAFGMGYNDSTLGGYIKTRANGEGSVSFGIGSQALGRYSVAWGMGTKTYGATSTVSGLYNVNYSMLGNVWGYSNNVSGDGVKTGDEQEQPWQIEGVTAFGKDNKVYGTDATPAAYSTVWGSNNEVSGSRATAWGQNNTVSAARATVFGYYNQALGENSLAGGSGSVADGDSAFALGTSEAALAAKADAKKGKGASAKGDGAIALDGSAIGKGAIAIGMGATSNMDHGIALGKGSLTTRKAGDLNAYGKGTSDTGAAWVATDAALAIGNDTAGSLVTRQITGVAAGSADTDAVNVAQLKHKADADAGNLTPANVTAWQTKLGTGTVSAGTEGSGLVTGVTMYNELRTQDGNYIKKSNTTSQNLTALDQKIASHDTTINDLRNNSYMNYKADGTDVIKKKLTETLAIKSEAKSGITSTVKTDGTDQYIEIGLDANNITFGKDGQDGKDGEIHIVNKDGTTTVIRYDGKDGAPGVDGKPGKDGRLEYGDETIATLNDGLKFKGDGTEVIAKKLNETLDITGGTGITSTVKAKADGSQYLEIAFDASDIDGSDITFGKDGKDGKDGEIHIVNKDGTTTIIRYDGKDGAPGVDGKDGEDGRIVYGKETVATLNDGLKFGGDSGEAIAKKLNEQLDIKGGADTANLTDGNIGVVSDGSQLNVKLAKDVKDLNSVTANNMYVTNVGDESTSVVNKSYLTQEINKVDAKHTTITTDDNLMLEMTPATDEKGANYKLGLGDKITVGGVTVGKSETQNADGSTTTNQQVTGLTNRTWDGKTIVSGRAATEDQLQSAVKEAKDAVTEAGFGLTDGTKTVTKKLGEAVKVTGTNGITTEVKGDGDEKYMEVSIGNNITIGKDGKDGEDGSITIINKDGTTTVIKVDGKDGAPGVDGKDGKDGRIEYGDETIATLNDGLKFAGDSGDAIAKKLNEQLDIKGGADTANLTDGNIGVVSDGKELNVKLAKDITGLDSIETSGGIKIGKQTFKVGDLNTDAINAVTGLENKTWDAENYVSGRAATEDQLSQAITEAGDAITTKGFGLSDGTKDVTKKLGETIKVTGADGITTEVVEKEGEKQLEISLGDELVIGGKDGKDGKDGSITIINKDGTSAVIGIDGKNGENGKPGVDGKDGITRIVYDENKIVATLDDGLVFGGDSGEAIAKKLNEQLDIKGGAKAELTEGNIGVVSDGSQLNVKLAKDLSDIHSITMKNSKNETGVVVGEQEVSTGGSSIERGDYVTGLDNTSWDENHTVVEDRAATEGQLADVIEQVNGNADSKTFGLSSLGSDGSVTGTATQTVDHAIKVKGANGITVAASGTGDEAALEISLGNNITVGKDGISTTTIKAQFVSGSDGSVSDGLDGINGRDGVPGLNGKDGITRIVYETPDGTIEEVATLKDGLFFAGDSGDKIAKTLNTKLDIVGGATAELTDGNIGVVSADGKLNVKLSSEVTGLKSVTSENMYVTNVDEKNNNSVTNVEYVNKTVADSAWKLTTNGGKDDVAAEEISQNDTVDFSAENGVKISREGANVKVGLSDSITVGDIQIGARTSTGEDGSDKTDYYVTGLTNKDWDGNSIVSGRAATEDQLKAATEQMGDELADTEFGLSDDAGNTVTRKVNGAVPVKGDGSIKTTVATDADGNKYLEVGLTNKLTVGEAAKDGVGGADGSVTIVKQDGTKGEITVVNGKDGVNGTAGLPGTDGKDGITRIEYKDAAGVKHDVATLEDGLAFKGDGETVISKKLNETLEIKGGAKADNLSDNNIGVVANEDGSLSVKLAKDVAGLTSVSAGNMYVTNVDGNKDDSVTNVEYVKNAVAGSAWKLTVNADTDAKETAKDVKQGTQVDFTGENGIIVSKEVVESDTEDAAKVKISLGNNITVGKDGADGKTGTITIYGKDGRDGKDGISPTVIGTEYVAKDGAKGEQGIPGLDGKDGADGTTRIVYTDADGTKHNVATLDDGLYFAGNSGDVVGKKLNTKLTIKGDGTKDDSAYSAENIKTKTTETGDLLIMMDKDLKADSYTAGTTAGDKTVITKDGITIEAAKAENNVIVTETKISAGNNKIENVADGSISEGSKDAVNGGQLFEEIKKTTEADKRLVSGAGKGQLGTYDTVTDENKVNLRVEDANGNGEDIVITNVAKASDLGDINDIHDSLKTKDDNGNAKKTDVVTVINNLDTKLTETIDTGMTFAGNSGDVSKKLGETVSIKGEGTKADSEYDGQNIKTIVDADGNLLIKMDKNLTADSYTAGGTVVNGDGITIAATTGTDGKDPITIIQDNVSFGGNVIHNVADGKERSDAATVGQLEDAITDAKNADKHIRTGTYAVGGQGVANGVSIDVISNENGKETVAGQVVITDMAKASEVGDVSGINKDLWNKVVDENGNPTTDDEGHSITKPTVVDAINNLNGKVDAVDAKVGDLDYSKVEGTKIEDGDSATTAIGKLDNRMDAMDSKIDDVSKSHTEVTADNGDKDADGNITKHKYEVALNPEITLGDKTNDGKLTVTGKDGNAVTVDGADGSVTAGDVVINKGGEGTISGLKNLDWDASKVDTAAADGGYKGSSKAATESQLQQAMAGAIQYDRKSDGSVDTTKVTLADNSGAGTTITNVADGKVEKGSKDAVNGGQLYETQQAIISNSQTIQNIGGAVNKLGTRIDRVGAGAAALAALHPLDFDPDAKWDFAAGYGNFRGANAAAIGAYYRPNEDVMVSIAGSMGGGENMVNAGVSVKLGAGHSNVSTSKTAMAKEIKEMRGIVAEQDAQIAKLTEIVNALVGVKNALPYNPDRMFPDVPENHWAYEAVDDMIARGLVEGYPDGTFGGDRSLTRYEFAMIVHRALLKGAEVSERLQQEFADELKYFTVDVVERDKDGVATIQRVRTMREKVNEEVR